MLTSLAYNELRQLSMQSSNAAVRRFTDYLLPPHELWARSYAQFIASRGRLPRMEHELLAVRTSSPNALYLSVQWEDADFVMLDNEIERLFQQIGWMP